jgi:hypothetical protein
MSEVDTLKLQIKEIQTNCEHELVMTKPHKELSKTLKKPYLVVKYTDHREFSLLCEKCSLVRNTTCLGTCPKCFSPMHKNPYLDGRVEDYVDNRYHNYDYYAVKTYSCPNNHFNIISLEFDNQ